MIQVKSKNFNIDQITYSTANITIIEYFDEYESWQILINTYDLEQLKELLNKIDV